MVQSSGHGCRDGEGLIGSKRGEVCRLYAVSGDDVLAAVDVEGESLGVPLDDAVWAIESGSEGSTGSVVAHEHVSAGRKVLAHEDGVVAALSRKDRPDLLEKATKVSHVTGGVRRTIGRRRCEEVARETKRAAIHQLGRCAMQVCLKSRA